MWQRVFAFLDRGSGGDGQWKGHTNEQPPTGKIIPPSMFTAQGLYCARLRFTLNILGMCACGTFYPWEEVLCGGLEMLWKKRRCVRVCVCALSRWTYSRSGCLSELRPDRCGSNLRPYDVIDYLIFWRPTHRPPLGLMDTHTKTHMNTYTNTWRHTLRSVHPSTRIRADWFCWAQDWTVYPIGSEKMMGAENVQWYHLSCVRCWYVCVVSWNWLSLEAVVVLFFCLSCHPWCLLVC